MDPSTQISAWLMEPVACPAFMARERMPALRPVLRASPARTPSRCTSVAPKSVVEDAAGRTRRAMVQAGASTGGRMRLPEGRRASPAVGAQPTAVKVRRLQIPLGLMLASCALLVACSSSSTSSTLPTPSSSSSPILAPSSAPTAANTANLTFAGDPHLSGTVTEATAGVGKCGDGSVHLIVTLNGQHWQVAASVTNYHGPDRYTGAGGFVVSLNSSRELWSGSSGMATYKDDRSLNLDADVENETVPNSPVAHVSGSISCG